MTLANRLLIAATVESSLRGFLLPHARHFRQLGWIVDCAADGAADSPECLETFNEAIDVPWNRSPSKLGKQLKGFIAIRRILQRGSYDIVHVHTPIASFLTRAGVATLPRRSRPVVIYTAHGFHVHREGSAAGNTVYAALERLAGQWTDYLVVINDEDQQLAISKSLVPRERVRYMPGIGMDPDAYRSTSDPEVRSDIRRELGVPIESALMLMVGELNDNKRHRDAIVALSLMTHRSIHLAIAGSGSTEDQLRLLGHRLGLADRLHLLGFRQDIASLMEAADLLVMTSLREGLPLSVMEAQAIGLPVVGTDIRGIRDLLDGGRGILVPVRDPPALAIALDQAIRIPDEARRAAQKARAEIGRYDIRRVLRAHEELYDQALTRRRVAK